jgi:hypothetical protein
MRYNGWAKNQGPQYVRGIMQGNGDPPGLYMWNTYSMNKEDIWISRTHLPITGSVENDVDQNFDAIDSEADLELWNFHIPCWAPVNITEWEPGNKALQLTDEEPYDYACAERHIPESGQGSIEFSVYIQQQGKDILEFELHNARDERALRLRFDAIIGTLNFDLGGVEPWPVPIEAKKWYDVKLSFDCNEGLYHVWINGSPARENIEMDIETVTLERMIFRTGSWRSDVRLFLLEGQPAGPGMDTENLAAAGEKVPKTVIWIDNIKTE